MALGSMPTQTLAEGVVWLVNWPCGQNAQPKSEGHQRRYLRYEANGVGYWF